MLVNSGAPGMANVTVRAFYERVYNELNNKLIFQTAVGGVVDRLTDTTQYTGSHKERFDASGKGKGAAGRENVTDNSGYVGGYKGKDTYDNTHK